jgi:hypothetical protein
MNNKELVKELLAIKDPETLLRTIHEMPPLKLSALTYSDELIEHVGKAITNNPEIREKIQSEAYNINLEEAKAANQKAVEEESSNG